MADIRKALVSPWRAVPVLGITQILAWGSLFYPPVLTLPLIAAERGWSMTFAMGGFSGGLLFGGLVAPTVGRLIDRFGGNYVMAGGSLAGATGLTLLVVVTHPTAYFATWMLLGAALAASLYDPAFATLGRIFGAAARRPITLLTFVGGFASTVSWPSTLALIEAVGWRGTYLIYAALLALVASPLHAFALPRHSVQLPPPPGEKPPAHGPLLAPQGFTFVMIAVAFACYAFITAGLSAHLLAIFGRNGIDAATAVTIGALFGPSQVAARLTEFLFAGNMHPLTIARTAVTAVLAGFAVLLLAGVSVPIAFAFMIVFGASNGLITVARGTVPLYLFGAAGYGRIVGRIAGPSLFMQAAGPVVLALAIERWSDRMALLIAAFSVFVSLAAFLAARRPR